MSRPIATSMVKSVASSSRQCFAGTGVLGARQLHQSRYLAAPSSSSTKISSIDPRVLDGQSFLPKENVQRITEWQSGLWRKLQAEVNSNPDLRDIKKNWNEGKIDLTSLITSTAASPNLTLAFNYASLLLNNSFFLEKMNVGRPQAVPDSMNHLEDKVAAYADGIVGSGWLWLVRTGASEVDILPTFGAGTFIVSGGNQRGRDPLPALGEPETSSKSATTPSSSPPLNQAARSPRHASSRPSQSKGGVTYPLPLAVLSLYEHAYIGSKYGVWGRKDYAKDWWRSLDWSSIESGSYQSRY